MGTTLAYLGKEVQGNIIPGAALSFTNATGPIYAQAQQALDTAKRQLVQLVGAKDTWSQRKTDFEAKYRQFSEWIDQTPGNYNGAIEALLFGERYGNADSAKWNPIVGDLRTKTPGGDRFIPGDWSNHVYNSGLANGGAIREYQVWLVKHWNDTQYKPAIREFDKQISDFNSKIVEKTNEISSLQKNLDKAIADEQKASGQRIAENQSDPAYVAAKAQADKIKAEADAKRRTTNTVLILGALAIAAVAGVLILRKG